MGKTAGGLDILKIAAGGRGCWRLHGWLGKGRGGFRVIMLKAWGCGWLDWRSQWLRLGNVGRGFRQGRFFGRWHRDSGFGICRSRNRRCRLGRRGWRFGGELRRLWRRRSGGSDRWRYNCWCNDWRCGWDRRRGPVLKPAMFAAGTANLTAIYTDCRIGNDVAGAAGGANEQHRYP